MKKIFLATCISLIPQPAQAMSQQDFKDYAFVMAATKFEKSCFVFKHRQDPTSFKYLPTQDFIDAYHGIAATLQDEYQKGTYQKDGNYTTFKGFTKDIFLLTLNSFINCMQQQLDNAPWLKGGDAQFFARKRIIPNDAEIEVEGDLHGDWFSLWRRLITSGWFDKENPFKLIKKNCYITFLGDYTDRGRYGAEVMFTIMQLYLHNPDNVLIVRGNHEDMRIVQQYGFIYELEKKFEELSEEEESLLPTFFKQLPVVIWLGCKNSNDGVDFVQCCHGGMETGFNSQELLEDTRDDLYQRYESDWDKRVEIAEGLRKEMNPKVKCDCKYALNWDMNNNMWGDFDFENYNPDGGCCRTDGRGTIFYLKSTTELLKIATKKDSKNKVWTVFRAHEHNEDTLYLILRHGNGLYMVFHGPVDDKYEEVKKGFEHFVQWSGKENEPVPLPPYSVWTYNVAPRTGRYEKVSPYAQQYNFDYDTVACLIMGDGFKNWVLQPRQIPVMKKE